MRALFAMFGALSILAAAPSARADEATEAPRPAVDHRQAMWRFELGYRGSFVTDAGYDPFSTNDVLSQVSIGASRTIVTAGRFSFAPGIAWDFGATEAHARGDAASLAMHRITAPLEGRVHLGAWGYAFLRAAPGVMHQAVEIDDGSSPAPLVKSKWIFATDLSAGYAWLAWPWDDPEHLRARLWLQADGGYGFAARDRLNLAPDLKSGDPTRTGTVDLGSLSMAGPFVRVAAAISF